MSSLDPGPPRDDARNPYAPPQAEMETDRPPVEITPMPFTIGDVLSRSWRIYRVRMGSCIGLAVGCWGLNFLSQMVLLKAKEAAPHARNPQEFAAVVNVLGNLAAILFQTWINIGQAIVLFEIARGGVAPFGDVFTGGRHLFRVFLANLVFAMVIVAVAAMGAIPGSIAWGLLGNRSIAAAIAMFVGLAVSLPLAIVVALRMSQFSYLIIDHDAGIDGSFRLSFRITRGKTGQLVVLGLIALVIVVAGIAVWGIGVGLLSAAIAMGFNLDMTFTVQLAVGLATVSWLVYTLPFVWLLSVVTYLSLTGQPTADPAPSAKATDEEPY